MRGDRVLVRGYKGEARVCRVLAIRDGIVELTDDKGLESINAGEQAPTVLFRSADVFVDDGTTSNGSFPRWEGRQTYSEKVLH